MLWMLLLIVARHVVVFLFWSLVGVVDFQRAIVDKLAIQVPDC